MNPLCKGTVDGLKCVCGQNQYGIHCENTFTKCSADPSLCLEANGTCVSDKCVCKAGKTGEQCTEAVVVKKILNNCPDNSDPSGDGCVCK